jgi:hypothetical protein
MLGSCGRRLGCDKEFGACSVGCSSSSPSSSSSRLSSPSVSSISSIAESSSEGRSSCASLLGSCSDSRLF